MTLNKLPLQPATIETANQLYTHMQDYYEYLDYQIDEYIVQKQLTVVCRKGCGICCYIKVDVNAHEVLYLAHYINNELSPAMRDKIITDLKISAAAIAPLNTKEHFLGRFKCGFLQDNCCAVHPSRPSMCRKVNSVFLEGCKQMYSHNKIPSRSLEDKGLRDFARDIIDINDYNFKTAGYDAAVYEINQAVLMALEKHDCMERWLAEKNILPAQVESKKLSPTNLKRVLERIEMWDSKT